MGALWQRETGSDVARQLVLACGNTLRGDDGVGWRIAEAVENDPSLPGVLVVVTHQLTPELAQPISGADTVIFVDCSAVSLPGEVSVFPVSPATDHTTSLTHNVNPATLLALAQEIFGATPSRAFAITVGGKSFELSEELTEPVRLAVPEAVRALHRLLGDGAAPV
jgi:hydrogenase maturation protease